jgi:hypothetical protein
MQDQVEAERDVVKRLSDSFMQLKLVQVSKAVTKGQVTH